jgi:hypothetical protein
VFNGHELGIGFLLAVAALWMFGRWNIRRQQSQRREVRLCLSDLACTFAEHGLELHHPRAQALHAVVVRSLGSDQSRHVQIISNAREATSWC